MAGKLITVFDKKDPGAYTIGYDTERDYEIWHCHPQQYNTSYLYEKNYTDERKAEINNTINENTTKLKGCMSFFKYFRQNSTKAPFNHMADRAIAEDEVRLKSLTQKSFNP